MSDQSFWGWAAKGLGGCANLLAMLAQEGSLPSAEHLQMLKEHYEKVTRVLQHLVAELKKRGDA